ncbi:hypothetical protein CYMTET_11407 [Cymbomonas tetramitiformis]|uniref:Uncharacterized protein n=1 Tax=Cymbomonas tetramitiformis TaxID=36881 RepID=A0AAE0GML3_9CHLO|nr:hypothetical protein CYMTET_11407 [Cymbomonas tetramitiformis]
MSDETTEPLTHGITHLWTTPILRHQLVDIDGPNSEILEFMKSIVLRKFRAFTETCPHGDFEEGETVNDRFFALQLEAFENDEPSFFEAESTDEECEAFETLRRAWLENAYMYVATVASEESADAVFGDDRLCMNVWASVHEGCSAHIHLWRSVWKWNERLNLKKGKRLLNLGQARTFPKGHEISSDTLLGRGT